MGLILAHWTHGKRYSAKTIPALYAGDSTMFWAIDGGAEMIQLFAQFGVDLDARCAMQGFPYPSFYCPQTITIARIIATPRFCTSSLLPSRLHVPYCSFFSLLL